MSTFLKLLAKIKNPTKSAGVNPNLREAVIKTQGKSWSRERTTRIVLLALVATILGGGVLFYLEFMQPIPAPIANRRPRPEPVQTQQSSSRAVAIEPVQQQLSTARVEVMPVAAPPLPVAKKTVSPAKAPKSWARAVRQREKPLPPVAVATPVVPVTGQVKQVTKPAEAAKLHDPALRDSLLLAARTAEERKDLNLALKLYRKAAEADPDSYRILTNIAGLNIQLGNYGEAFTLVQQALALRPDYLPALVNGGIAAARLGKDQDAAGNFSRALGMEPTHRSALYNLALLRERGGNTGEAGNLYRRLMETGDPQGYLGAARLEEQQRHPQEARRLYRALLALPEVPATARSVAKERLQVLE